MPKVSNIWMHRWNNDPTDTRTNIYLDVGTEKQMIGYRQTDRQTGRQTDRQTDRQAGRQTDRQTDMVQLC